MEGNGGGGGNGGGWGCVIGVGGGGARSKPRFQYPPNSALTGYVFISAHLSTDTVSNPLKVWTNNTMEAKQQRGVC